MAVKLDAEFSEQCLALAQQLQLPVLAADTDLTAVTDFALVLVFCERRLSLCKTGAGAPGPVCVDFAAGAMNYRRRGGQNELLGRALGIRHGRALRVLDATAGLGVDSYVLADLGCDMLLCERSPVVAALLADGLARALQHEQPSVRSAAMRMSLYQDDCRDISTWPELDAIYLDPMFPKRRKSAMVKKEMQLLQQLPGTVDAGESLLDWAKSQDVARIVVKRPLRAPTLARSKPSHEVRGKAVRYDVYVLRGFNS